ncbi:class F sortase [Streptomyces sp. NPDC006339]|uniref:class F sortase n=1 Tax=Streptomyces sp. NPDC006339 TaxID=3156755 RepID=UPI0033AC8C24
MTRLGRRAGAAIVMLLGAGLTAAGAARLAGGGVEAFGDQRVDGSTSVGTSALPAAGGVHQPSPPLELRGPDGLRVTVRPVGADRDGVLDLPEEADVAGWWALGAPVGAARGTTLLAGHVDTPSGPAPFAALHDLPRGTRVEIRAANGRTYAYRIVSRRLHAQGALPTDLFTADGAHRLVLVTCGGRWDPDEGRYDGNLVLQATPA